MTCSDFPGVRPVFVHSDHMLNLALRVNLDAQIGRTAYSFLERLYNIFQALSNSRRRNGQHDLGWDAGQEQKFRISNARLAEQHRVQPRHIQRLLNSLQSAGLIKVEMNGASDRLIDLSPLYARAVEWRALEKQRQAERQRLETMKERVQSVLAQYSVLLSSMRAKYAEPAKRQANVLEHLSSIEHLRIAYAECSTVADYIDLEPLLETAQKAARSLTAILDELKAIHLEMAQEAAVDETTGLVGNSRAAVDNNLVFSDRGMTEMSPPPCQN